MTKVTLHEHGTFDKYILFYLNPFNLYCLIGERTVWLYLSFAFFLIVPLFFLFCLLVQIYRNDKTSDEPSHNTAFNYKEGNVYCSVLKGLSY